MLKSKGVIAAAASVVAFGGVVAGGVAQAKTGKAKTKTKADSGVGYFSVVRGSGANQQAAGIIKDKILGNGAVTYELKLAANPTGTVNVTAKKVTLYDGTGSLTGTATATITVAGTTETITNGKLNLTKGTGSLKGAKIVATFVGTANTAANQYQFTYKGKLTK